MSLGEDAAGAVSASDIVGTLGSTEAKDRQGVLESLFKLHSGSATAVLDSLLDELVAGKFKSERTRIFRSEKYLDLLLFGLLPSPLLNGIDTEGASIGANSISNADAQEEAELRLRLRLLREVRDEVSFSPINLDACVKVQVVRRVLNALNKANFGGPGVPCNHDDILLQRLVCLHRLKRAGESEKRSTTSTWALIQELLGLVSAIAAHAVEQADVVGLLEMFRTDSVRRSESSAAGGLASLQEREKLLAAITYALSRACSRGPLHGPDLVSLLLPPPPLLPISVVMSATKLKLLPARGCDGRRLCVPWFPPAHNSQVVGYWFHGHNVGQI